MSDSSVGKTSDWLLSASKAGKASSDGSPISPETKDESHCSSTNSCIMDRINEERLFKKVIKECQLIISYVVYELLLTVKGSMTEISQQSCCAEYYHGTKDNNKINQSASFMAGDGKYQKMFDIDTDTGMKYIKHELTQDATSTYFISSVVGDEDEGQPKKTITLRLINAKYPNSPHPVSGANVKKNGSDVLCNCKLAIGFGKSFLDANGKLPSGCNRQDYFNLVCDKMFQKELTTKCNNVKDSADREIIMSKKRPVDWFFPGFMSFVIFGPLATDESSKSELMMSGKFNKLCIIPFIILHLTYTT